MFLTAALSGTALQRCGSPQPHPEPTSSLPRLHPQRSPTSVLGPKKKRGSKTKLHTRFTLKSLDYFHSFSKHQLSLQHNQHNPLLSTSLFSNPGQFLGWDQAPSQPSCWRTSLLQGAHHGAPSSASALKRWRGLRALQLS